MTVQNRGCDIEIGLCDPIEEWLLVDGVKKWGQSAAAAVIAGVGALALIAGTGAPLASASSNSPSSSPATLAALVAKAKAELVTLAAEVQAARTAIASDKVQIGQERRQLANLVSEEYTGAPNGLLSVLASPDFNTALDTQIELSQLTASQRQLLLNLAQDVRNEQASEAALQQEQKQASATESRLQAEELVAEFQASQAADATFQPKVQGGPASKSSPAAGSSPSATPTPTPTPVSTPTPGGPAPTPPPSSPPASEGGGSFTVNTNLTLPSGISLQQIQEFLQGTPLEADASYFLQAEQSNHVSAIYLVSDAVLETRWGTSALYTNKHNLFGFEAYDANPYVDGETFTSDQDCISYVSWFVSAYYLTPPGSEVANYGGRSGTVATGQYYNGPTPKGMNVDYARDQSWASKIAQIGALLQTMSG
ncbi:MAG: glucosaminidase domain-containing protein [Candidatus Dormibacteria bacterium]